MTIRSVNKLDGRQKNESIKRRYCDKVRRHDELIEVSL